MTYNVIGNIMSLFCQWMILMIIPKITDFSEAGVFAAALSICSILNGVATFSIPQYQVSDQYVNYKEHDYRTVRMITISISFAMCPFLFFLGYSAEQVFAITAYMIYRNLLHYAWLHIATLQIHDRLDYVGKCMVAEGAISLISFVSVYYATHDLVVSILTMGILGGGAFLMLLIHGYGRTMGRKYPSQRSDRHTVKELLMRGVPLLFSGTVPVVITALPKLILQAVSGDAILGIFSTLSAPTIVVPTIITGMFAPFIVAFSNISRAGDLALLRRRYLRITGLILLIGTAIYTVSAVFGGWAFEFLYGEEISPYVRYFKVLIVGIIFYSIGMCGTTVLVTKEQGKAAANATAVSLLLGIIIFVTVIPMYGIEGATYGLLAAYGIFGAAVSLCVLFLPLTNAIRMKPNGQ